MMVTTTVEMEVKNSDQILSALSVLAQQDSGTNVTHIKKIEANLN